jgi:hypothetical protein
MNPFTLLHNEPLFESLDAHTYRQLRVLARLRKVCNYGRLNKQQLLNALTLPTFAAA